MSTLSLRQIARHLGTDRVSVIAVSCHFAWPPPPAISLRKLFTHVPYGAIVLSGGGTRTDFQVGALHYLTDRGHDTFVVTSASGGSPNAAKLAEGEGTASLERYWRALNSYADVYRASDWVQSLSSDPLVQILVSFFFLGHHEALVGIVSGIVQGAAISSLIEGPLGPIAFAAQGLITAVRIGLDVGKIASDISNVINSGAKSILATDPIRTKLNGTVSNWIQLGYAKGGFQANSLSVVSGLNARLEAFMVASNNSLFRAYQSGITSPLDWTDWNQVPAASAPSSIAVTAVQDNTGNIQVFRLGSDNQVYQARESSATAGAPMGPWSPLTAGHTTFGGSLVVVLDGVNRVRALAIGTDGAVYQLAETAPGTGAYGSWSQIGASSDLALSMCAGKNFDGRLEVFRVAPGNQVFHAVETSAGGAIGNWEQIGQVTDTAPAAIDVALDSAGFLQVCRSASDGSVYMSRQRTKGYGLVSWDRLPRPPQGSGLVRFGTEGDGTLHLYMVGGDKALYHSRQEVAGGTWSSWFPVQPGKLEYTDGSGGTYTDDFPAQDVHDIVTARNWNGQLEAFVRGHQLAPMHVSQTLPLLDAPKVKASGMKLRMSIVSLESTNLRYANENGEFVDNPAEGQFSLGDAVVASGTVPGTFPPIKLLSDNYIDGGTRDLLPIKAAIDAGANSVIAVVATEPVLLPAPSFDNANFIDVMSRGLIDIMPNQILQDHLNPPVPWTVPVRSVLVTHLPVHDTVHGEAGIEPGLVAIAIDYGYMRACDDLDPKPTVFNNNPSKALHDNTDAIIDLRLTIWQLECNINGQRLPLQDIISVIENKLNGTPIINPIPDSTQLPTLRQMKWQLKGLVDQRRLVLGGRVPPGVESWWLNWEPHAWGPQLPVRLTPWMAYKSEVGPDIPSEPPPLGDDNRLLAEKSSMGAAYIVFGGAKFFVPLPWKNFLLGNAFRVPDGSLQYDQSPPADGTVLREDAGTTIYVIFGGAKFAIPGIPWPGAVPGTSAGAVAGVNIVPNGSLSSVGNIPVDGTLLSAVNAAGAIGDTYVIWGGAKFLIPQSVAQNYELCADLGYLQHTIHQVPDSTLAQIPDVPQDGTVLREIDAADPYLIQFGTKKEVLGRRRFFDLGLFWPDVGTLWDGALDILPDGGPA